MTGKGSASSSGTVLPDWLATAVASDASEGRGILPPDIRPLVRGSRVAGPAFTVQAATDDNKALAEAIAARRRLRGTFSSWQVTSIRGQPRRADLWPSSFTHSESSASSPTDWSAIRRRSSRSEFRFGARGVTPLAPQKGDPGNVGVAIRIGDVEIQTGDIVIADDDGVVVWPHGEAASLLTRASARNDADIARAIELRS